MKGIPILCDQEAESWVLAASRPVPDLNRVAAVREIIERVRNGGDEELFELAEAFDGGRPQMLRVPIEQCREALDRVTPERRQALELAVANLLRVHSAQLHHEDAVEVLPGVRAWREFRAIDRIGVYAPGGRAAYPSSVLMSVVPAKLAGVREVAVCSPGGPTGKPPESVLAACALTGVDEVYSVGGAQAIAALALGTMSIKRVDKIFGPGGAWVNAAKLALFPEVAIDLPAGPSEVTVWADSQANAEWVASELVAQAEHGPDSVVVAVLSDNQAGDSSVRLPDLAARVAASAEMRAAQLEGESGRMARASLAKGAILVAGSDTCAARWVNELAPEHLSIMRPDAEGVVSQVRHTGSVFLGDFAPVAAGDYCSGTNHVLPTGGRARATSGLSVSDFGRWMQVQSIEREGLERLAPAIEALAEWEGLPAHADSVKSRLASGTAEAGGAR